MEGQSQAILFDKTWKITDVAAGSAADGEAWSSARLRIESTLRQMYYKLPAVPGNLATDPPIASIPERRIKMSDVLMNPNGQPEEATDAVKHCLMTMMDMALWKEFFHDTENVALAWESLNVKFSGQVTARKQLKRSEFNALIQEPEEPACVFNSKVRTTVSELKALGGAVDDDQILEILFERTLPKYAQSILTFKGLRNMIPDANPVQSLMNILERQDLEEAVAARQQATAISLMSRLTITSAAGSFQEVSGIQASDASSNGASSYFSASSLVTRTTKGDNIIFTVDCATSFHQVGSSDMCCFTRSLSKPIAVHTSNGIVLVNEVGVVKVAVTAVHPKQVEWTLEDVLIIPGGPNLISGRRMQQAGFTLHFPPTLHGASKCIISHRQRAVRMVLEASHRDQLYHVRAQTMSMPHGEAWVFRSKGWKNKTSLSSDGQWVSLPQEILTHNPWNDATAAQPSLPTLASPRSVANTIPIVIDPRANPSSTTVGAVVQQPVGAVVPQPVGAPLSPNVGDTTIMPVANQEVPSVEAVDESSDRDEFHTPLDRSLNNSPQPQPEPTPPTFQAPVIRRSSRVAALDPINYNELHRGSSHFSSVDASHSQLSPNYSEITTSSFRSLAFKASRRQKRMQLSPASDKVKSAWEC